MIERWEWSFHGGEKIKIASCYKFSISYFHYLMYIFYYIEYNNSVTKEFPISEREDTKLAKKVKTKTTIGCKVKCPQSVSK
jgi:hypothetical protein